MIMGFILDSKIFLSIPKMPIRREATTITEVMGLDIPNSALKFFN